MTQEEISKLEVIISANADQFRSELNDVNGKLNSLSAITKKSGSKMTGAFMLGTIGAQVLMGAVKKVSNAIFTMSKEVMNSGTQLSRMRVATNTVTRNMGIATSEVDDLRRSLAESNTYGIKAENVIKSLAITGLWEMSKQLKTVDGRTGEMVTGVNALVLTMKDLAAVAGIDSSEGIARVTDFINRGITSEVEGMIAVGNLGTEYRMFAKTLGKTRMDLTAQEEAQARLNLVQREGKKALGAYAESYTTAGKMMGSIRDATKSIFEELGASLEPIFASVSSAILKFVSGVRTWLINNSEVIRAWAVRVAGWVVWLVRSIGSVLAKIPGMGEQFKGLINFQVKTGATSKAVSSGMNKMAKSMGGATKSSKELKKELAGLAGFDEMNILKQEETDTGGSAGGSGMGDQATEDLGGGLFEGIGESITEYGTGIGEKFGEIVAKIKEFLQPVIDLWNKWVKPAFDGLIAQVKMLWDTIMKSPIGEVLKTLAQVIGVIIVGAITLVIYIFTGLIRLIEIGIQKFTDWFNKVVEQLANLIIFFRNLGDNIKQVFLSIKDWIIRTWATVATWFNEKVIAPISNFFTNLWNNLKNGAVGAWDKIKSIFGTVGNWFKDTFSNAWEKVKNVFSSGGKIFDGIKEGIGDAFKAVVNTLIRGINAVISVPFNAINTALRTIKNIEIMGLKPFQNLSTFTVPKIPYLAEGGVIDNPTIAMLGESGKEVVLPLERNTEWIDQLASKINGRSENMDLTVKIGEETIFERTIDYINDRSLSKGSTILNI